MENVKDDVNLAFDVRNRRGSRGVTNFWLLSFLSSHGHGKSLLRSQNSNSKCPKQTTSPGREVVCYTSASDIDQLTEAICKCTTLVHQGHDARNVSTSEFRDFQKSLKELNPPLQFVISIDDPEKTLRTSGGVRQEFTARLMGVLSEVDGVELNVTAGSKERLLHFVKGLRDELLRKSYEKRIFLVLPTKSEDLAKQFDLKELSKYVDLFAIPTHYLVEDEETHRTFHPSRLMGLFDMFNADSLIDLISGLGAPKRKILMSLPASAFRFSLVDQDDNAPAAPTVDALPISIDQKQLCDLMNKEGWTVERDEDLTAPYAFKDNMWIAFEDKISVAIKGKYALIRDLPGLAVHEVENDSKTDCNKPLTHEIHRSFSSLKRKSRAAVLNALEDELHQTQLEYPTKVKSSNFRVVRVVDTEGHIRAVRENTQIEFTCSRQGYFVHPKSCNRFYRCVKFNQEVEDYSVFEFDCPAGLSFDERTEVCVWPGSMPEGSPCPGSSEIAPVARVRFECPSKPGYYADPQNPRWFFACIDLGVPELMAYEFRCPFGLIFDEQKLICEWPWLVVGYSGYTSSGYATGSTVGTGGYYTGALPHGYSGTAGKGYLGSTIGAGYSGTAGKGYLGSTIGAGYSGTAGKGYLGSTIGAGHSGPAGVGYGAAQGSTGYTQTSAGGYGSSSYSGSGASGATVAGGHLGSGSATVGGGYSGVQGATGHFGGGVGGGQVSGGYSGTTASGYSGADRGGQVGYSGTTISAYPGSGLTVDHGISFDQGTKTTSSGYSGSVTSQTGAGRGYSQAGAGIHGGSTAKAAAPGYTSSGGSVYTGAIDYGSTSGVYTGSKGKEYSGAGQTSTGYAGTGTGATGTYRVTSATGYKATDHGYSGQEVTGFDSGSKYSGSTGAGYSETAGGAYGTLPGGYTGAGGARGGSTVGGYTGTSGFHAGSTVGGYTGTSGAHVGPITGGYTGETSGAHVGSTVGAFTGSSGAHIGSTIEGYTGAGGSHAGSTAGGYTGITGTHVGPIAGGYTGETSGAHVGSTIGGFTGSSGVHTGSTAGGYTIGGYTGPTGTHIGSSAGSHGAQTGSTAGGYTGITGTHVGSTIGGYKATSGVQTGSSAGSDGAQAGSTAGGYTGPSGVHIKGYADETSGAQAGSTVGGYTRPSGVHIKGYTDETSGAQAGSTVGGYTGTIGAHVGPISGGYSGPGTIYTVPTGTSFAGSTTGAAGGHTIPTGVQYTGSVGSGGYTRGSTIESGVKTAYPGLSVTQYPGSSTPRAPIIVTTGYGYPEQPESSAPGIGAETGSLLPGQTVKLGIQPTQTPIYASSGTIGTGLDTATVTGTHGQPFGPIIVEKPKQPLCIANCYGSSPGLNATGYTGSPGLSSLPKSPIPTGYGVRRRPGIVTVQDIQGGSTPGTLLTYGGTSGTVIAGSTGQASITTGSGHPGYVKTGAGTPGYVISGSASPGTTIYGTSAPGVTVTGPPITGTVIKGQSSPGFVLPGQTAPAVTIDQGTGYQTGGTGPGSAYGTKIGTVPPPYGTSYETNEYHDNGGRGTIKFNNGGVTTKYTENDIPDYRPTGGTVLPGSFVSGSSTPSGFTKTGFTGKPRPTVSSDKIGAKAFEGNVVGYTKSSTEVSDGAYSVTPSYESGVSGPTKSTGYSYVTPSIPFETAVTTESPIGLTRPFLTVEVHNTPGISDFASITGDTGVYKTSAGFSGAPTGAPGVYSTIAGSETDFGAPKSPFTVSTGIATGSVGSSTPATFTQSKYGTQTESQFDFGGPKRPFTVSTGIATGSVGSSTPATFTQSKYGSQTESQFDFGTRTSQQRGYTGTYQAPSTTPQYYYESPTASSGLPSKTAFAHVTSGASEPQYLPGGRTYQSTVIPSGFSRPYSTESTTIGAGGSPTNVEIPREEVGKLVTNYNRGSTKYVPNQYDIYSTGADYSRTQSSSLRPGYISTTPASAGRIPSSAAVTTYSGTFSRPSSSVTYQSTGKSTAVGKGKVIVKWSDLHPLLLGKLGAECTCRGDPFANLRGPGSKLINSSKGKVDLASYDESDIYVDLEKDDSSENDEFVTNQDSSSVGPVKIWNEELSALNYQVEEKPSNTYLPSSTVSTSYRAGKSLRNVESSTAAAVLRDESFSVNRSEDDFEETIDGATNCARPGLFRHPNFCNKFYGCHWDEQKKKFSLHVFSCPVHLTFDNGASACNWPSMGPACQDNNLLV
ncbi:uncharacterized protein LOC143431755 [Xylocopa sonorina]|uniref:uncharacterized protein LOC143431755 n=1 Tax=Xylocopa sonorina TaxID=1818115 RepID=UPI00403AB6B0